MSLRIEYLDKKSLKPYAKNAKIHTKEQIEQIKRSILEFGFNDPIAIWHNNEIVEGHGRLLAAMEMSEVKDIPVIRLDELTDEQRRAYMLVHNKLTMNTDFDLDLLKLELDDIEIDMTDFGFELEEDELEEYEDDDDFFTPRSSLQHNVFENQERMQFPSDSFYGMPNIKATQTCGNKFLRFCDYKEVDDLSKYIAHFYYDDYKFVAAWRQPDKYLDLLRQFKAVVAPDFSLYIDFPRALQILSCYRRQWCGAYWQSLGIDVIPDVVWGDKDSYEYCFDGIPKHSVVATSSVGVTNDSEWNGKEGDMFRDGYNEMLKRLEPTKVIFYGTIPEGIEGDIIRIPTFYEEKRQTLNEMKKNKK